jgi:hypothetical protein
MRRAGWLVLAFVTMAEVAHGQAPQGNPAPPPSATPPVPAADAAPAARPAPVGTMSELMLKVIYPYSDAMFYIQRSPPKNDVEWNDLQGKALALAEFGNVMMMPGRARDQDQWMRDAKLLVEAGRAAFVATKAKDVDAVVALNEQIVMSCTSCHMHYRPNYGRRRGAPPAAGSAAPPQPPQR